MLQEHHGLSLLEKSGISVPAYGVAKTAQDAYKHAERIGIDSYNDEPAFLTISNYFLFSF